MRIGSSSGLRSSASAVATVGVTALIVWLFQSPYTPWGSRNAAPTESAAVGTVAADHEARDV